ncbi:DUF4396 domain-containing protein [Mycobacterium malmoense]|uniref:DUF4396 domain-containing protein n=1 Tax=Mycobacterium malmoense TaxID=1780 RepID=UPI0021090D14|nr:DUF4396 domain-containing protein [Mycobacterium malmoense]
MFDLSFAPSYPAGEMTAMTSMTDMVAAPAWVTLLGWIVTGVGVLIAGGILVDVYVGGYRQPMWAMELVWAITAVYAGPLTLWAYCRWGRPSTRKWQRRHGSVPQWGLPVTAVVQTIPGGAASFTGHLIAIPIVMSAGLTIGGRAVWPMILLIAAFALPLLTAFEWRSLSLAGQVASPRRRLGLAVRISVLAVAAFDLGMGAAMLLVAFVLGYAHTSIAFWLVMWGGMLLGFVTAYPMVWWLLARDREAPHATRYRSASRCLKSSPSPGRY